MSIWPIGYNSKLSIIESGFDPDTNGAMFVSQCGPSFGDYAIDL
jgi:hypothetical protein